MSCADKPINRSPFGRPEGDFSIIFFDEYMGEGAFEQVCDDMSFYQTSVRNGTAPDLTRRQLYDVDDAAEQAKRHALDLVAQFAEIRTKEREKADS